MRVPGFRGQGRLVQKPGEGAGMKWQCISESLARMREASWEVILHEENVTPQTQKGF